MADTRHNLAIDKLYANLGTLPDPIGGGTVTLDLNRKPSVEVDAFPTVLLYRGGWRPLPSHHGEFRVAMRAFIEMAVTGESDAEVWRNFEALVGEVYRVVMADQQLADLVNEVMIVDLSDPEVGDEGGTKPTLEATMTLEIDIATDELDPTVES